MAERLPSSGPDDLDGEQRALYDVFVSGPRQTEASFFPVADAAGVLSGPYRAMLLSPALGRHVERLGRAVRYESRLPARVREVAVLTVARHMDSEVEWRAHEGLALAAGLPAEEVAALHGGRPGFADPADALVHRFAHQLLADHRVDDATFAELTALLGSGGVFDLLATVGYYQLIAHLNNAFALEPHRAATAEPRS